MKVINLQQGTKEWHDYRQTKVGASEVSYLFNENPFCSSKDQTKYLLGIKLGFNQIFVNSHMRAGNDNEAEIVAYVEEKYNIITQPLVAYDGDISASFDGITFEHDAVIEVKYSTDTFNHIRTHKTPPRNYYLQVQQQMLVSGAKTAYFASMNKDTREIEVCEVEADAKVQNEIKEKIKDFMEFMHSQEWTADDFNEERTDDEWASLVDDYKIAKLINDEAKQKLDEAKKRLIEASGGSNSKGFGCTVYKTKGRETINYKAIIDDAGLEIDDKYKKIGGESWSIRLS